MAAQIYNFPEHTNNDTFNGVQFEVLINAVAADLTDADIKMQLRDSACKLIDEYSVENLKLELTDPTNGIFTFKKQIISLAPQKYSYDIEITFANGDVKTWIKGEWKIIKDITH